MWGFCHAAHLGADEAIEIARELSKTSPRYMNEGFDNVVGSFQLGPGYVTTGTLLHEAKKLGFDLGAWFGSAATTTTIPVVQQLSFGAPFSQLPHVMDPGAATAHLNARLFKASDWGGKPSFGRFNPDGTVSRLQAEDIQVLLSGHFVEIPDGKGGSRHISAATWWVQSSDKTVFDRVVFDPENKLGQAGKGFSTCGPASRSHP